MTLPELLAEMRRVRPACEAQLATYFAKLPNGADMALMLALKEAAAAGARHDRATLESVAAIIAMQLPDLVIMSVVLAVSEPVAAAAVERSADLN